MKENTHAYRTLKYLRDFGKITSLEAFRDLGNTRLSATIYVLRHKYGYNIQNIQTKTKNRYGETVYYDTYVLVEDKSDER